MKIKLFNPKAKLKVYLCNREKPFYPKGNNLHWDFSAQEDF